MTAEKILKLATIGLELISTIGVPATAVLALFRQGGVDDDTLIALESHWGSLESQIEQRIAALKAQIAAG